MPTDPLVQIAAALTANEILMQSMLAALSREQLESVKNELAKQQELAFAIGLGSTAPDETMKLARDLSDTYARAVQERIDQKA